MALDRETLGRERTTGQVVRKLTGDTSGGTTLTQVNNALQRGWDVTLEVRKGASIAYFDDALHDGHGAVLQGASSATRGTKYSASETFGGNHSWWVNEGRGWRLIGGVWVPTEYLVYDPLADGRRDLANAPFWLPRPYLLTFAKRLDLNGDGALLGPGKVWAMFTRDTEPHVHAKFGGRRTDPFPDRTRANPKPGKRVSVRTGPSPTSRLVDTMADGELFIAYQRTTTGTSIGGSRVWYGDHDGNRWIHESGLRREGGST